jgi:hypothetical protein
MKINKTVSIEQTLAEWAKKSIENFSEFVENAIREHKRKSEEKPNAQ